MSSFSLSLLCVGVTPPHCCADPAASICNACALHPLAPVATFSTLSLARRPTTSASNSIRVTGVVIPSIPQTDYSRYNSIVSLFNDSGLHLLATVPRYQLQQLETNKMTELEK